MSADHVNALRLAATLTGALALAACGGAENEDYEDVATGIAAMMSEGPGGERESLRDCPQSAKGHVPDGFTYEDRGQMHGRRGELEYDFRAICKDPQGEDQESCNDETASAHLLLHWYGHVETWRHRAEVMRSADWFLTDLDQPIARLDGTGHFDVGSTFKSMHDGMEMSFDLSYDATYSDVRLRMLDRVILSGRADYQIFAKREGNMPHRSMDYELRLEAVVIFDDAGGATLSFDGEHRYYVDLTTGRISRLEE